MDLIFMVLALVLQRFCLLVWLLLCASAYSVCLEVDQLYGTPLIRLLRGLLMLRLFRSFPAQVVNLLVILWLSDGSICLSNPLVILPSRPPAGYFRLRRSPPAIICYVHS